MIKDGDFIFLYGGKKAQFLIKYTPEKPYFECHLGKVDFPAEFDFGDVLYTNKGKPLYVLKPATSDLVFHVKRFTTIMYPKDMGYVVLNLGIKSGDRVIEVGSGSGAMTIVLASLVGDEGMVYSFERREEFLKNAAHNVKRAGLSHRVKFILRDVEKEGFGVFGADSAVIDVPEPWTLVKHVKDALKGGAPVFFLSPNIEQVQKTYDALREHGFVRMKTVEILEREIKVREGKTRPMERMISHTGYLTFAYKVNDNKGSGEDED